jgi:hypothetical protein
MITWLIVINVNTFLSLILIYMVVVANVINVHVYHGCVVIIANAITKDILILYTYTYLLAYLLT